jgi:hypothetical protein
MGPTLGRALGLWSSGMRIWGAVVQLMYVYVSVGYILASEHIIYSSCLPSIFCTADSAHVSCEVNPLHPSTVDRTSIIIHLDMHSFLSPATTKLHNSTFVWPGYLCFSFISPASWIRPDPLHSTNGLGHPNI